MALGTHPSVGACTLTTGDPLAVLYNIRLLLMSATLTSMESGRYYLRRIADCNTGSPMLGRITLR